MVEECTATRLRPRDRIAGAARDLFHKHGIRGIGVDAIAEAAGTNKMTLYRHFGSKDDLIIECLRGAAREADAWWAELEAEHPGDPLGQLRAWVLRGAECVCDDDRGCDLANAAVELAETDHPARPVIEALKIEQRDRLAKLCRSAGIAEADLLADTLFLLIEGARVSRQSAGAEGPSAKFVRMCETIIPSFREPAADSAPSRKSAPSAKEPSPA
jgi:AcrR family transcriptional regulator